MQQLQMQNHPVNIEDEMKVSYLDYAMSVIIGRALPDVRDGLKPVHRRILFSMHELGLVHNKPFKKSARVVGEVLGKYHPHGDAAVYDAIVRMVQDFSLRNPLILGQGNFGSVDGLPAAAMRYTEVRMSQPAEELLADLERRTVDFTPNFDGSLEEPIVLPARFPNLLVNGSSGIAVGMATNIPPHNLGEVADGLIMMIDNPEVSIQDLQRVIKGPDFPTAAFIYGRQGVRDAYATGRGIIRMRARAEIETHKERETIIITELPYQVNKARLLEGMADLVRNKKLEGISALRDESDREGMRIVVEVKRDAMAQVVLNQLYKHTAMQSTFGVIMLALVEGQPRVLNLKEMLWHYLQHRREIVVRRTRYELEEAERRLHILEGLTKALDHLDEVISLIRAAESPAVARASLIARLALTEVQAQAILDLKLQRLTALERDKIIEEHQELLKAISSYRAILGSEALVLAIIKGEIQEIKKRFTDPRRTTIVDENPEINLEDMIAKEDMVVVVTHGGYIKRSPLNLYKMQKRSGAGVRSVTTKEEDFVEHLFVSSTHDYLLFFSDTGRVYWLKVHELPQGSRQAKGSAIVNLLALKPEERITAMMAVAQFDPQQYVAMATLKGVVKKTSLEEFSRPRPGGIIAISLDEGDKLIAAKLTDGQKDIFLISQHGLALRFHEDKVRGMGRQARGVRGIKLRSGDCVVGMEVVTEESTVLTVTEKGYGKRTRVSEYQPKGRGCLGVVNTRISPKNGQVVGATVVSEGDGLMLITAEGTLIWIPAKDISLLGRATMGVKLQNLGEADKVVALAKLAEGEDEGGE